LYLHVHIKYRAILSVHLAILRKPKLLIEPASHIRVSKGDNLRIRCFDPYETDSTIISWFRCVELHRLLFFFFVLSLLWLIVQMLNSIF